MSELKGLLQHLSSVGVVSALVVGRRTGLLAALAAQLPRYVSVAELASLCNANTRVVLEWCLSLSAVGGVLEWKRDDAGEMVFRCPPAVVQALTNPEVPYYVGGLTDTVVAQVAEPDRLAQFVRTGEGFPFAAKSFAGQMEDMHEAFVRHRFFAATGSSEAGQRLARPGVRVVDIGCCSGQLLRALARRNPQGRYTGLDIEEAFLAEGRAVLQRPEYAAIADRITLATSADGEGEFDVVVTTDMLHDCTAPEEVLALAARLLAPDGLYLAAEPRACETLEAQLRDPQSLLSFGLSLHGCLPSAMARPGGPALGTLGLPPSRLQELAARAGFRRVERIEKSGDPFNDYFLLYKSGPRAKL